MKSITDLYPALSGIADYGQWLDGLRSIELAANSPVYTEGQPCQGFPLLLSGCIRVFKQAENGREIELYRIDAGESCIVSISSLISNRQYQARAVTERASVLYLLPAARFHAALSNTVFRDYVLGLFADRMTDLMERVEEVAFQRLDARLANRLLGHGQQLHVTHAQLANELGSVREIISRLLKGFETRGWIKLSREQIDILDPHALRELATHQN